MALMASPAWRATLIGSLYAWQGLVAGFALTAIPNHYAALGASTAAVGAHVATVGLPWIVQPLWGPVVDRYGGWSMGRRRFWVVLAFLGSLLSLTGLLLVEDDGTAAALPAISAVFLLQGAFAALADTATDAMIIDHMPPERLGAASAVTRIGFVGGSAAGAVFFAWVLASHGLRVAVSLLVSAGVLMLLLPLLVREKPGERLLSAAVVPRTAGQETWRASAGGFLAILASRDSVAWLAGCFAIDAAAAAFAVPLGVELIQARGWTAEALSNAQSAAALTAGTLGALLVGWWTDRQGVRRTLGFLLGLCAVAHIGAGLLLLADKPGLVQLGGPAALALSTIVPALVFVALAPAVMRRSHGALAATRFAVFMAALNMGSVAGAAASAQLVSAVGLPAVGLAAGTLYALLAIAWRMRGAS
ncbi:MFS transporter [Roseomonas sp. SSH11]|uniref:MFS transporter n=1 Tax=Pararoseomonas baculiformis TaxID=2820812 RepID=A0ABS4AFU2_9PROT|nr:MFS transporter [Pararoseomonas baculiformis]MBP0445887.1 MFS transporter [Pararoseomonas baculiformis]